MFPWQSGSDGREESQRLHLNPRSGHWNPDASARAHHIGIAVAYNAWKFYQVTGDLAYLIDYGAELLAEIARFFVSLATYDEERERFGIRGVIGPDEFHSGYPDAPYDGIDNNAYTNVMAVWVIMRALDALNLLPLPNRLDLMETLGLHSAELAHWEEVSRRMYVPFHDGVISQFEGYGELAELDWDRLRGQYGNIQRLDRILEAEHDDVNRYKASKQADALMLLYLLSATELRELLDRLGYRFTPEQVPEMVDYYLARTSHGSTLSGVVHTWVLARANRDRAHGILPTGAEVRRLGHPGRHHFRGHPPGGHGRHRRPHAALLHRAGDPVQPHHPVPALAGIPWRAGDTDPLPRSAPAPAGQREGCDHQRGSTRRRRDRGGMPRSGRSADARNHRPLPRLTTGPRERQPAIGEHFVEARDEALVEDVVVGDRTGVDVDAKCAGVDVGEQRDIDRRADCRAERVLHQHPGAAEEHRHRDAGNIAGEEVDVPQDRADVPAWHQVERSRDPLGIGQRPLIGAPCRSAR